MNKIIILNAPPRTGKDTIANLVMERNPHVQYTSFKLPLFKIFADVTNTPLNEFLPMYDIPGWKDEINTGLNNHTPREFLIHISENFIKPFFGPNFFGNEIAGIIETKEVRDEVEMCWIIPDGGFNAEVEVLAEKFPGRVVVMQIQREGHRDFGTDSRTWIDLSPVDHSVEYITVDTTDGNDEAVDAIMRYFAM